MNWWGKNFQNNFFHNSISHQFSKGIRTHLDFKYFCTEANLPFNFIFYQVFKVPGYGKSMGELNVGIGEEESNTGYTREGFTNQICSGYLSSFPPPPPEQVPRPEEGLSFLETEAGLWPDLRPPCLGIRLCPAKQRQLDLMKSPLQHTPLKMTNERHYGRFPQLLSVGCNINMQIPWA